MNRRKEKEKRMKDRARHEKKRTIHFLGGNPLRDGAISPLSLVFALALYIQWIKYFQCVGCVGCVRYLKWFEYAECVGRRVESRA